MWLCKCFLLGNPVVSCLVYSSSVGVREVADTRVCSNGSPTSSCDLCGVTCQWTTARSPGMGLFVQNENTAHVHSTKYMQYHMSICCTAILFTSLFLHVARVSSMSAVSHINTADRHAGSYLETSGFDTTPCSCVFPHPAVVSVFSSTVANVCIVLTQNAQCLSTTHCCLFYN